ncbi:alcohol dehydrogenase [Penicillium cosmopolitanum]|uniref:Alcohol dehydrogenase n=1 Tax=Penicillium cosmopolitanum TaxID=1131564 RepID=A0A9W9W4C7_9EURO|nr:alcohol dehydrogenase [Penicillium cosmopolitanum]KAJ5403175.1 alcohol dehydrogenase [Penicillium cosmopolitanum]
MATKSLPKTCRALVLNAIGERLHLETRPTPQPTSGSAVIKILAAAVLSYSRDIYNGTRNYELATPSVPGSGAIGRVAAIGPDAAKLQVGDLVFIDIYIRGRDDYSVGALSGINDGHSEASKRMMRGEWRDSTYAEYARLPLENCFSLNEKRLLGSPAEGGLGYTIDELLYIAVQLVPFGGLRSIGLAVCDKIIISPATGAFGSAAVQVALAMGASVIAMGRNNETLENLKSKFLPDASDDRIQLIQITNDLQQEFAAGSSHIKSAIMSLRHSGRICLMGGAMGDMAIPASPVVRRNLTIKGKWMYERDDILKLIQMVESGALKLGREAGCRIVGRFPMEKWKEAFDAAAEHAGPGERVSIIP